MKKTLIMFVLAIPVLALLLMLPFLLFCGAGCTTQQVTDLDAVIAAAIASLPTNQVVTVPGTLPTNTPPVIVGPGPVPPVLSGNALDDLSGYVFYTTKADVAGSPVVSQLKITRLTGSVFRYEIIGGSWPNKGGTVGNLMCALYRDGKWRAGPCDAMKPAPNSKGYKSLCVPDGKKRLHEPIKGEKVRVWVQGFCRYLSSVEPNQRTSVVELTWGE
jgi:hypothetical protein